MTHRIYTTEAIVLAVREAGEGTRTLSLFTPDLGLIFATAQGLRELKSKLRYSLQLFSLAKVSLVRGREVWRLVGAVPERGFMRPTVTPEVLSLVARVAHLTLRLIHGETAQSELFAGYKANLFFLNTPDLSSEQLRQAELLIVLRLLHRLGYIEARPELAPLLNFHEWDVAILDQVPSLETSVLRVVNQALQHSHL